jgi:hypothetical protein
LLFTFIKTTSKRFNLLFWIKMMIGPGIILLLYCREAMLRYALPGLNQGFLLKCIPDIVLIYFSPFKEQCQASPLY